MASKRKVSLNLIILKLLNIIIFLPVFYNSIHGLSNLTQNDPFPYFSTMYPYDYLSIHERIIFEKIGTTCFDEERWTFSFTPFFQMADNAIDINKDLTRVGDLPGKANVLALFWDSYLRSSLIELLNMDPNSICMDSIINPEESDPTLKNGFFSYPTRYKKGGCRFQLDLKIWEKCFDAIGFRTQFAISNIKQNCLKPINETCNALGIACPATTNATKDAQDFIKIPADCENPRERIVVGSGSTEDVNGLPCVDTTCCIFSPNCECKTFVTKKIMNQFDKIAQFLGIDNRTFEKTEPEDLRISLWWRHIKEINSVNPAWSRILWIPFIEAGVGIPLTKHINPDRLFAIPFGNNGHTSAGAKFGFALDFIDILEIATEGGFTKFFKQEVCGLRLPTHARESRLYPYKADVLVEPGMNSHFSLTLNARNFIDRLSTWVQYLFVNHNPDCIKICRSLIPEGSDYYPTNPIDKSKTSPDINNTFKSINVATIAELNKGFDVRKYTELTDWEVHMFNIGFNYNISPNLYLGAFCQHTFNRRNAFCTDTVMLSATVTF